MPMARKNPYDSALRYYRRSMMPLSLIGIGITIASLIFWWGLAGSRSVVSAASAFEFASGDWYSRPWTLIAYVLVSWDLIGVLAICIGFYYFAGAIERSWGTAKYGTFMGILVVLCPLSLWLGYLATGSETILTSFGLPLACAVVAFATLYPRQQILVWAIIPIQARWIGWFTAVATVFYYGRGAPIVGLSAGLPIIFAWAVAGRKLKLPRLPQRRPRSVRDPDYHGLDVRRREDVEAERRKLKELFERSFGDEDENK